MSDIHISLAAETITHIGPLPITNTLVITWLVMLVLLIFTLVVNLRLSKIPDKFQIAAELIIGALYSLFETVTGKNTKTFFPLVATIFLLVLMANWTELLPGLSSIRIKIAENHDIVSIPVLRSPSADLNFTLALALVSIFFVQWFGIKALGVSYLGKFFDLRSPVNFIVGILEIISEFARIISFAFRLFGNIFAGEVLLIVVAFLIPLIAPLPFLALELFIGLIQAFVFSMLTAVFLNLATAGH